MIGARSVGAPAVAALTILWAACGASSPPAAEAGVDGPSSDAGDAGKLPDRRDWYLPPQATIDPNLVLPRVWKSGSRLRVRSLITSGGDTIEWEIIDNETHQPCRFLQAEDGVLRCLPARRPDGPAAFSDPACKVALLVKEEACDPLVTLATGLAGTHRVFRTMDLGALPAVYGRGTSECKPLASPAPRYVARGEPVPPEMFVAISAPAIEQGTAARLRRFVQLGADGFVARGELFDTALGVPCTVALDSEDQVRCLPPYLDSWNWDTTYYADAACTQEVVLLLPKTTPPPVWRRSTQTCPVRATVGKLGAPHQGRIFGNSGGTCLPLAPSAMELRAYLVESIPLSRFERFDPVARNPGRLAVTWYRSPEGEVEYYPGSPFFDRTLDVACNYARTRAGYRCLPGYFEIFRHAYADPACSMPLPGSGSVTYPGGACWSGVPFGFIPEENDCQDVMRVFDLKGDSKERPLFSRGPGGACQMELSRPISVSPREIDPATLDEGRMVDE